MVGKTWVCLFVNNFDDGKHLGMFVSQQFWWREIFGCVGFSTVLMVGNNWVCLVFSNFDDGKHLGMFISQQF
jgi:hypothetical protein